jgi:hypothetical protein
MLAWAALAGAPGARVGHDAGLGVAIERDGLAWAEDLLAAGAQLHG